MMGRGRPAAAAGSPNSSWQPAAPPQRTCTPLHDRPDRGDKADRHHTAAGSRASGRRRVRALLLLSAQRAGCLVIDPVSTTPATRESAVPARGWRARRRRSTAAAHAPRPAASCPPQVTLSAGRGHKWSSRAAQACGLHSCCRSGVAALRPVAVYCRYVPFPATHRTSGRPLLSRWQFCLLARLRQGVQDTDALVAMLGVVQASPHSEASHATGQAADASWRARPMCQLLPHHTACACYDSSAPRCSALHGLATLLTIQCIYATLPRAPNTLQAAVCGVWRQPGCHTLGTFTWSRLCGCHGCQQLA